MARCAVTVAVMTWPTSSGPSGRLAPVAPSMATPSAYHWTARLSGTGSQVPVSTVRVDSTCVTPASVGATALDSSPGSTTAVGAEVADRVG